MIYSPFIISYIICFYTNNKAILKFFFKMCSGSLQCAGASCKLTGRENRYQEGL